MNKRKQFQVKLPNKPGRLAWLGEGLGNKGINIIAIAGIGEETPFVVNCYRQRGGNTKRT